MWPNPGAALILAVSLVLPAFAHHSRTQFEGSPIEEIAGTITAVSWTNPHAAISVAVTTADGSTATWQLESWGSPYVLSRMGVTAAQFRVGSEVRLAGRVSRLVSNRFLLTNMLTPDGIEVILTTDGEAFWEAERIGGRSQWRTDPAAELLTAGRGIFQVWSTARMGQARNNRIMLTARGLAARESFVQAESFVTSCEPQGMPTVMNWVYPFEFSQATPGTILLRNEYFNLARVIHLPPAEMPTDFSPDLLGYSVGHWEDNGRSLVVETTGISWPHYDTIGTPLTTAVRIEERFTVSEDETALSYQQTVIDHNIFTEPAVHRSDHLALGETVSEFICAPEPQAD